MSPSFAFFYDVSFFAFLKLDAKQAAVEFFFFRLKIYDGIGFKRRRRRTLDRLNVGKKLLLVEFPNLCMREEMWRKERERESVCVCVQEGQKKEKNSGTPIEEKETKVCGCVCVREERRRYRKQHRERERER